MIDLSWDELGCVFRLIMDYVKVICLGGLVLLVGCKLV